MIERIDTVRNGRKSHHYKIDGKRAIGVTTALNGIPKQDFLIPWASRRVAEFAVDNYDLFGRMLGAAGRGPTVKFLTDIPPQERDDAADRGTEVHTLADPYARGMSVDVPDELAPHVRGFAKYIEDFNPITIHTELVVASRKYGYAGTLDSIEDIPGYGRCLVDWKTGNGVYGEYVLQCAAYRYADLFLDFEGNEHEMLPVDRVFILHIKPDDYDLIPVQADEVAHEKFLCALDNYRENVQSNKLKKLIGEPVKPVSWEAA